MILNLGASIINEYGDLVSTGTNEVPKFGGGHYINGQQKDTRNLALGYDPNDQKKKDLLTNLLKILKDLNYLNDELKNKSTSDLVNTIKPDLRNTQLMDIIEFNTEVHAEMNAIIHAARNTISVRKGELYTTTFPCHDCTKHIIAAGIKKVMYIEPYPKSLTSDLYSELVSIDESNPKKDTVSFKSYVGISPYRYMEIFEMGVRKNDDGSKKDWQYDNASPRFFEQSDYYLSRELKEKKILEDITKNLNTAN